MSFNKYIVFTVCLILGGSVALAGSIKRWSSTETFTSTDINANFTHIHKTMVGGHGARLVNADVSSSAAIAHSKVATPALLSKAWANIASCDGSQASDSLTCTLSAGSGITSVKSSG